MNTQANIEKIKRIISKVIEIPVEQIPDDVGLNFVKNWTSLNHIFVLLSLEENYNFSINEETIREATSATKIFTLINKFDQQR
jgi:acyl carrier protein